MTPAGMAGLLYPLPGVTSCSRRSFLAGTASFAAAVLLARRATGAPGAARAMPGYPFALGVASGDPAPDGFVLWTRLAPQPRVPGGGMPPEPVEVGWQVAADEAFSRIVREGTAVASPDWAHSVHVEVGGLAPARWFWYRFRAANELSPVGRTRTMPAVDAPAERLRFAFASCQKYEIGHYTAFEHLAREDLDLIVHLGDYIYEKGDDRRAVRPHGTPEILTLDDYRGRYGLYKSDLALQAAHAAAPWIVTWDDHEVSNNYAAAVPEDPMPGVSEEFLRRRAAGYQAYFEHMPLRRSALPSGPDMLLHRRLDFGRLATFHVLDTRQYRTDQPDGDGIKPQGPAALDPAATILGERQRTWLFDGLARSEAAWNVVAQQVMVARLDRTAGAGESFSMDKWTGYEAERRRLLRHFLAAKVANPVVITGDVHNNWANELPVEPGHPDAPSAGVEFVGTSISSGGDGEDRPAGLETLLADNPFVKYHNNERGYVRCEVTPAGWRTDFRTVPYVSRPGASLVTRASFVVESGRSQLART